MELITDIAEARQTLAQAVDESQNLVFLGGAGVSVASGIPDFRSVDGLYHQKFDYPPETMLSHEFYETHPEEFFRFYKEKMIPRGAKPNQAHYKLAQLEQDGPLKAVLTQNIDGLHQMAGSKSVLELHGSVHRNKCLRCGEVYSAQWVLDQPGVPVCDQCGGPIKPDVVLYGEALDQQVLNVAADAVAGCDTLVIGGTSLVVWPVAGLVQLFGGKRLVMVNLQPTPQDAVADLMIRVPIEEAFDF
ncbi:NAD-dependent protein deacylase [Leptogranulimonas caecicola]|jgi:NAD-dependent deacetylase|uniref:NAD-dependent protein deacetylase n=2 Tax=Coriobacteriales TaxID=84999 RepID=A0A4S2F6L9_9ACTN|nr:MULTISPECIES: NAD-dependent protein deacylase [Atopobiaceae]MCI8675422.1 NAD-dependent protein deacylase [Atopobiaceae bacterium]TGY62974.1 NAD-dependent protein deacylase [Muricaecibacterium torontonense]BCV19645.1 NAD-dependent protein deacetylase [Atopobiaceae bacterium P1]BDC90309.1 NAD-dependent protein deacetylase [Leptogranulimonas caecicola]